MFGLGPTELIIIFVVILLVFGPKRLPEMGRSLGHAIREFRTAGKELQRDLTEALEEEEAPKTASTSKTTTTGESSVKGG